MHSVLMAGSWCFIFISSNCDYGRQCWTTWIVCLIPHNFAAGHKCS